MTTTYKVMRHAGFKSGWAIDDGSGHSIRYTTKADAGRTIERWIENERQGEIIKAEDRAFRLEAVNAYLAVRAVRKAETAKQLAFAF